MKCKSAKGPGLRMHSVICTISGTVTGPHAPRVLCLVMNVSQLLRIQDDTLKISVHFSCSSKIQALLSVCSKHIVLWGLWEEARTAHVKMSFSNQPTLTHHWPPTSQVGLTQDGGREWLDITIPDILIKIWIELHLNTNSSSEKVSLLRCTLNV